MIAETIDRCMTIGTFSIEDWTVEPQCNRISNGEISVHLEPKAMKVLLCLADRAGEVVTRQALVDNVWATEFISDSTLTHTVADLRRALADDARAPRFIETIPKRGYRLVAEMVADSLPNAAADGRRRVRVPLAVIIGERVRVSNREASILSDHFLFLGDQEIPLTDRTIFFGRGEEADIQILVPEVSRCHARIEIESVAVMIEDLGSKNGTLVNNEPIDRRFELASGDAISIGPTTLVFRSLVNDPTRTQQDS